MFGRVIKRKPAQSDAYFYVFLAAFFLLVVVFMFVAPARQWALHLLRQVAAAMGPLFVA